VGAGEEGGALRFGMRLFKHVERQASILTTPPNNTCTKWSERAEVLFDIDLIKEQRAM
jgi:hypothetical protein